MAVYFQNNVFRRSEKWCKILLIFIMVTKCATVNMHICHYILANILYKWAMRASKLNHNYIAYTLTEFNLYKTHF